MKYSGRLSELVLCVDVARFVGFCCVIGCLVVAVDVVVGGGCL